MARLLRRLFGFVLALFLGFSTPGASAADGERFFDQGFGDFPAELRQAAASGKKGVLLVFEAEACPYCRRMRREVLGRDEVADYYRHHFAIHAVDILGDVPITDLAGKVTTEKAFARAMRVRGTPTFLFLRPDGREITRYVGATRDVREFMALGRYVVEGHANTQSFEQFYPDTRPERKRP